MKTYLQQIGMTLTLMMVTVLGWGQSYTSGYPTVSNITSNSATIEVSTNISSYRTFFVLLQDGSTPPSIENVIDGVDANEEDPIIGDYFNITIASTTYTYTLESLSSNTNYDLYIVTRKKNTPYTQIETISASKIEFTTQSLPTIELTSLTPLDNSTNVNITSNLTMTFDGNIQFNTTGIQKTIKIYNAANPATPVHTITCIGGFASWNGGSSNITGTSLTLDPTDNFELGASYYITVDEGAIESTSGGVYGGFNDATTWNFSTPVPLTIVSFTPPTSPDHSASISDNLIIEFSEKIQLGKSGTLKIYEVREGGDITFDLFNFESTDKLTTNGSTLSIDPDTDFKYSTTYYIKMESGLVVSATTGTPCPAITENVEWRFTTIDPPAPATTFDPANGSTSVDIRPTIKIMYDQPIRFSDGTVITNANVESLITNFSCGGDTPQTLNSNDYSTTINSTKDTITIELLTNLNEAETFTLTIAAVENALGQDQSSSQNCTFDTETYIHWTGITSTDWGTGSNWSSGKTPSSTQSARIKNSSNIPVVNAERSIRNLLIDEDAALTIGSAGSLNVAKKIDLLSSPDRNASLIIDGNLSYTPQNLSIRQKVTSESKDYYISSPVSSATPATIGNDGEVYKYITTTWSAPLPSNEILSAGVGYAAWNSSGSEFIFRGSINNDLSYPFSATRTITPKNNFGWNLAGNPYPSAIDWNLVTKNNMTNAFWVVLNETGGFGTFNGNSELGTNVSEIYPSEIPSGHAFWTQVLLPDPNTTTTYGSLEIAKNARIHNSITYLKSTQATSNKAVLRFVGFNGNLYDEMVTALIDGANDDFDLYDSEKKFSTNVNMVQIYSLANSTKCAINCYDLNSFNGSLSIPVGFKVNTPVSTEKFGIGLKSISGFPDDIIIELEDTYKKQKQVLTTNSYYCFSSTPKNTEATDFLIDDPNRFIIHLKSASAATKIQKPTSTDIMIYSANNEIVISGNNSKNAIYQISDINGTLIKDGYLNADTNTIIPINKPGIVFVKIISSDKITTTKILIK